MNKETRKWILIELGLVGVAILVVAGLLVFFLSTSSKPVVKINSPASGGQANQGQEIILNSTMTDSNGIVRVELAVDNNIVRIDNVPVPQKSYNLEQTWQATPGSHVLAVRAFNAKGTGSDAAIITLNVIAINPTPIPTGAPQTPIPSNCAHKATLVSDVTLLNGSTIAANQSFNKTWRVQNTGNCAWTNNFQFIYIGGESMANVQMISVPHTLPGGSVDLVLAMSAPSTPGLHIAQWQLRDDYGNFFGPVLEAKITTAGPTPTATAVPSFLVTAATASVNPGSFAGNCPGTFVLSGNVTTNNAGSFTYRWVIPGSNPSDIMTFNAHSAGTFTLIGYTAQISNKGGLWGQLQIITPNSFSSNQAVFVNNCIDPKPAPPQALILQPGNGFTDQVNQPVRVIFQGNGNTEVSSVSLYANGMLLNKQTSRSPVRLLQGTYDWVPAIGGNYELWAVAIDIFGQQTTSPHITGFVYQPAPQPTNTPIPPTRVPPTPVPPTPIPPTQTPVPQRRDINGTWSAGEWVVELSEAMGCSSPQCSIAGTLTHAILPSPEIHAVSGTANLYTGIVTWAVAMPGGRSFSGTLAADSRTMTGNLSGVGTLTFTK